MKKCGLCGGFAIVVAKTVLALWWRCLGCGRMESTGHGQSVVLYPS